MCRRAHTASIAPVDNSVHDNVENSVEKLGRSTMAQERGISRG